MSVGNTEWSQTKVKKYTLKTVKFERNVNVYKHLREQVVVNGLKSGCLRKSENELKNILEINKCKWLYLQSSDCTDKLY